MTLRQNATNKVTCTVCGWARVLDPHREYRGGHTDPSNMQECHEMLRYEEMSPLPIEVYLLGEDRPKTPEAEIDGMLNWGSEDAEENATKHAEGLSEQARNASLDAQIASLFELAEIPDPATPE